MRLSAPRLRRIVLRAALLVFVLVGVALLSLLLFFDPLVRFALAPVTRDLKGTLDFDRASLSWGQARLTNVRVDSSHAGDGRVLEAAELKVELRALEYLASGGDSAELLGDITVVKPVLNLRVDPDGSLNLARLFVSRPEAKPWLSRYAGTIEILDGLAYYRDERRHLFMYKAGWQGDLVVGPGPYAELHMAVTPEQETPGKIDLSGWIAREVPAMDLRFKLQNVELGKFAGFPPIQQTFSFSGGVVHGDAWARGRAPSFTGLFGQLAWGGNLELVDGSLQATRLPWPVRDMQGTARLVGNAVHLDELTGRAGHMPFSLKGDAFFSPQLWLDLLADFPRLDASHLRELSTRIPPLEGLVSLELAIEGPPQHPEVRGLVSSARIASGQRDLQDVSVSFRLQNQVFLVEDASAETAGGRVSGDGFVLLAPEPANSSLMLDVRGQNASLGAFSPGLTGQASFQASILGTLKDPLINGEGQVDGFSGVDSARGRFLYGGQLLMLREATLQQGATRVDVPSALVDLRDRFLTASVRADDVAVPPVQVNGQTLTGNFSGQGVLWGLWDKPASLTARGMIHGTSLALGGLAVADLAGEFLFADRKVYLPGVTGSMEGGEVAVAGRYDLDGQDSRLSLAGDDLPGSIMHDLLGVPVTFHSPIDTRLLYADGDGAQFRGVASGAEGDLAVSGTRAEDGRLDLVAYASEVELDVFGLGAFGRVADDFSGIYGMQGLPGAFSYTVDGQLHGPGLGTAGPVDITGWGRRNGAILAIDKAVLAWDYPAVRRVVTAGVSGQAYPFAGPILAPPLERVRLGEYASPRWGLLTVSGSVNLAARTTDLRYRARDLELGWVASRPWLADFKTLNQALGHTVAAGVAEATGTVRGPYSDPTVTAQLDAPWLALAGTGAPVYSARGSLVGNKRAIAFQPLWVSGHPFDERLGRGPGQGLLELRGRVAYDVHSPTTLVLSTEGFEAPEAVALLPRQLSGPLARVYGQVSFDKLRLTGSLARPALAGQVMLAKGGLPFGDRLFPLDSLLVDFSSQGGDFAISRLQLDSDQLRLQGNGMRTATGDYVAQLYSSSVPLSYLHNLGSPFTALDGTAELAVRLQTRAGQPVAYVGLESPQLTWSSTALTGVAADPVTLSDVRFGRFERMADGSLVTGPGQGVELSYSGTRGTLDIPADSVSLGLDGATLGAQGAVSLQAMQPNETLTAWFQGPRGPDFGNLRTGPFQARMENFRMSQLAGLLGLMNPELEANLSGTLSLEGQWFRDLENLGVNRLPRYSFEARSLELARQVDEQRIALTLASPATASFERVGASATLSLTPARLNGPTGYVEAAGDLVLAGGQASNLTASSRDLPLEVLALLNPSLTGLKGSLQQMDLKLAGVLPTPEVELTFQAQRAPEAAGGPALGLQGQVTGRSQADGGYLVDFGSPGVTLAIGAAAERLSLGGQIPLKIVRQALSRKDKLPWAWEGVSVRSNGEMNVTARIEDQNMQLLDTLIPQVTRASGKIDGSLEITGTVEAPEVVGGLTIENGNIQTSLMQDAITNLNVVTKFEQISPDQAEVVAGAERYAGMFRSRYSIERFEGLIGTHPFTLAGKAEMAGFAPTYLNLALNGTGIPITQEKLQANADVALTLDARPGRTKENPELHLMPVLTGTVDLPDGDLYLSLDQASQGVSFVSPVRYDVDLTLGDNFWVHVGGSRVRAQGNLKLQPDPVTKSPVLSGSAFLSRGVLQIPFYSVAFNIRQGWAYWDRSLIPTLENVEADTTIGTYQIVARVDGTYPDLKVELFSNPPLAQADLVRLVAVSGLPGGGSEIGSTNIPMNNFLQSQGLAVLSGLVANPITQQLSKVLFLSEVSFDYQLPATYVVKLAKALDAYDRILLTLTRIMYGNGLSESLYGLEYRFQPNLLTRVALDDLGQLRFWFQGIFSWW